MEKPHPLVLDYEKTILGFPVSAYARMNEAGSTRKYTKIYRPLTHNLLRSHLRGDVTLAASLLDSSELARAAVLDIDEGGDQAVRRVLELAEAQHFVAFAGVSENIQHQGGHVWLLFAEYTAPSRLRNLATQLATQAGIKADTYPTKKAIRLPLGIHRWTGKRGLLYLPDGGVINLDDGEYMVKEAIRELRHLPLNPVSALPQEQIPIPKSHKTVSVSFQNDQDGAPDVISIYNNRTDLVTLLEGFGGRVAEVLRNGGALLHCPCPHHKHHDARPSIEVRPARNRRKYGEFVVYGYAPGCAFYTERGQVVDAFGVYCRLNTLDPDEAVKQLSH